MSGNKKYFCCPCEYGIIKIAYDVVAVMAYNICVSINGVAGLSYADISDGEWFGHKGIVILPGKSKDSCHLRIYINIFFKHSISEIVQTVQNEIKNLVANEAGIEVENVDVFVAGIAFEKQ